MNRIICFKLKNIRIFNSRNDKQNRDSILILLTRLTAACVACLRVSSTTGRYFKKSEPSAKDRSPNVDIIVGRRDLLASAFCNSEQYEIVPDTGEIYEKLVLNKKGKQTP